MKRQSNIPVLGVEREQRLGDTLLAFYFKLSLVLTPLIIIHLLVASVFDYTLSSMQVVQAVFAAVVGILVLLFRNMKWLAKNFEIIHYAFLASITTINGIWFATEPDEISLISLMMVIFFSGLLLIKPIPTSVYVATTTVGFLVLCLVKSPEDAKYFVFLAFFGLALILFSFWRDRLSSFSRVARESYRNIFSDLAEQVFVVNNELKIIDFNKAASDSLIQAGITEIEGTPFNVLFTMRYEQEKRLFQKAFDSALKGQRKRFETDWAIANSGVYQYKEVTIRKTNYFGNEALVITLRLIQDQRDFESRLFESKENIARVLENINSFIFNITYRPIAGNHQVNYVSSKVKEVYGLETDEYITLIKSGRLHEIFYHEDRDHAESRFNNVLTFGQPSTIQFRIVRYGEIRWVEEKIFPKKLESGDTVHLFGIVTDITEQVQTVESLEESERRYRQIFERNMAGVYKTHVDGTILDANIAFARILGFDSVAELKKHNVGKLYYYQTDRKPYLDQLRKEGFLNNQISVLRRQDGKRIVLNNNVSIHNDEDGNPNIIEGTLIDITEIEETSTALKASEQKYRLLFAESREGILLIKEHREGLIIVDANQVASELLGVERNELNGLNFEEFATNPGELKKQLSRQNTNKIHTEWVITDRNGKAFAAEISVVVIEVENERLIQLVMRDVSERKRNEEILRESQQSFKNIVDNSPAAILIFTDEKLVYTNPQGVKLYSERLNSSASGLYDIFPERLKHLINDLIREEKSEQNSFTEIELIGKEDTRQYSLNTVKTVYNGLRSDLFMLQDITLQTEYNRQRLRAEIAEDTNKKLQDEIERHRITQSQLLEKTFWLNALFESSYNLFILSLDENYNISSFNENFRRMMQKSLGIDPKVGDSFLDLFEPEGQARKRIESRFERVLKGETLEFISHFKAKSGEVWVESFLNPVKLGDREVSEISFISHEITDRIESQKKIKISEANNRAILLALPDTLLKVNSEGVFTDFRTGPAVQAEWIRPYIKNTSPIGKTLDEVINNLEIVAKFKEIVSRVLTTNDLETFTFELAAEGDGTRKLYFENRFSKLNESEVIVLARNVTETIEYEAMLVESVREKEILLKEVHHRVKNNLQVINSILNLQSSYVEDTKTLEIINESQNRIRSMSYIHESLYQTKDFSSINFADYITNLVQNLVHSYQLYHDKIDLKFKVGSVQLALDQAIPCGLILNELVSNALKYAYPGDKKGEIVIEVSEVDGKVSIAVEDFGIGLPDNFKIESSESLGLSLVYTLVDQLDGQLSLKRVGGTKFLITFEKQEV